MEEKKKDGRGGAREGAGRKRKADEAKLIEKLDNIIDHDDVIRIMRRMIFDDDFRALQLYMNYRFGKPQDKLDVTTDGAPVDFPMISFIKKQKDDE